MATINKSQLRQVTVLIRYFIKATQSVVLYVENDKGARYYVRLQENGVNTCNCKATKECYHIKAALNSEQARPFAAKRLPVWAVELVKAGLLVVPSKAVEMPAQSPVPPIAMDLPAELRGYKKTAISTDLKGELNGAQQSAGLLMSLPSRKRAS